jgi:tetratricopeptide (TPR) repeat protein
VCSSRLFTAKSLLQEPIALEVKSHVQISAGNRWAFLDDFYMGDGITIMPKDYIGRKYFCLVEMKPKRYFGRDSPRRSAKKGLCANMINENKTILAQSVGGTQEQLCHSFQQMWDRVLDAENSGKLPEAICISRKMVESWPNDPLALWRLGYLLLQSRQILEAKECFLNCLRHDKQCQPALSGLSDSWAKLRDWIKAEGPIRRSLFIKEYHFLWVKLGIILWWQKRFAESAAACDEALRLAPAFAEAFNNKACALHALNRDQDALSCIYEGLSKVPDDDELLKMKERLEKDLGCCRHD